MKPGAHLCDYGVTWAPMNARLPSVLKCVWACLIFSLAPLGPLSLIRRLGHSLCMTSTVIGCSNSTAQ